MTDLLAKMKRDMELAGFSPKTQADYLRHIKAFHKHFNKPLEEMWYGEIKDFLHHAITVRQLSGSYVNSAFSAIRFFYQTTLERDWKIGAVPRAKRPKRLPSILSLHEVSAIINVTQNIKHKAILMTAYSAGLRVSEAARLRVSDIDSKNMQIAVRQGKGRKDRYSMLSQANLLLLRQYWKLYRPSYWLFPGKPSDNPIAIRNIQQIFYDSAAKAGITKDVSIHTLRHCFATHLLEQKTDIWTVKQLLGHANIQTTCKYLHLRNMNLLNVKSPLDLLDGDCDE